MQINFRVKNHGLLLPFSVEKYDHQVSDQFDKIRTTTSVTRYFIKDAHKIKRGILVGEFLIKLVGIVYKIPCNTCSCSYIGQTGQKLSIKITKLN